MTIPAELTRPQTARNGERSGEEALARLGVEALTFDDVLLTPGYTETLLGLLLYALNEH